MPPTFKKLAYADEVAVLSDEVAHDIGTTASAGVATDASRHDHVHVIGDGAVNTAAKLAADIVDKAKINADVAGKGLVQAAGGELDVNPDGSTLECPVDTLQVKDGGIVAAKLATDAVETAKIKDANVTVAKINIDGNLNMNKKELTAAALDNQASDPTTPVLGQVYFKTGDTHPYVCTAT